MSNIENARLNLLEHQKEAYDEVENLFENGKHAAVIFPTGCGKSFVTLKYILEHSDERILFLAPRNAIKEQMYEYVVRFIGGLDDSIEKIIEEYGSMEKAAQVFIPNIKGMLYQSVLGIGKKESIDEVISKLKPDLIVIDEMHHVKTKKNLSKDYIEEDDESLTDEEKNENKKEENEWGKKFKQLLDMYLEAKVLGLSATPIRPDGANVVERIFDNAIASEISLLEAMEEEIIVSPKYVVPDFLKEEELNTLLEQINLAEGEKKESLKAEYDRLVEESGKAPGIPELLDEHITQRDGKYIIFCKDIKDMEEKQAKAQEWFEKIDKKPTIYRVSSKHADSQEQLDAFNHDDSDHLKLMYCVGMIDEGVHLNDVSGVILTAKTGSRVTYLQRLGRAISSGKDKKRALVIDLVNNNEILFKDTEKNIQYGYEITDLEALEKLMEWINDKNNSEIPNYEEAKSSKEKVMAKRMARLNHKYYAYVENKELLEKLDADERKDVEEIIALGEDIGLWDEYIEIEDEIDNDFHDRNSSFELVNNFLENIKIKGVRKSFFELLEKADRNLLNNALEIEEWCKTNYGDKKIWERKLPSSKSKDEYEKKLGQKLNNLKNNRIKKYDGKKVEEIESEEDRQIVEIVRRLDEEYGLDAKTKKEMKEKYLSGQDIGQASFDASTSECDNADAFMRMIVEVKDKNRGG